MIYTKLPDPECYSNTGEIPEFADHMLLTERLSHQYDYPEHKVGFGIISLLNGEGNFCLNKKKIVLGNNSYLVVNKASELSIQLKAKDCEPSILYFHSKLPGVIAASLYLSDDKLLTQGENAMNDFSLLERPRRANLSLMAVLRNLSLIGQSCASFHALKADLLIRGLLERLCLENKKAVKASNNINAVKRSTRKALYLRMAATKEWMEGNYHQPMTLDTMSRTAMMNSQHFLRVFKQTFQVTPHQYLINIRLRRAQHLLTNGDETVTTICGLVGFESLSSFSWLFRQSFHLSPTQYRQQTRNKPHFNS